MRKIPKPIIDKLKCNTCGTCIEICPMNIFIKKGESVSVQNPDECIGCRACEAQCSKQAIVVDE